VDET
jgi:hypothetical protein